MYPLNKTTKVYQVVLEYNIENSLYNVLVTQDDYNGCDPYCEEISTREAALKLIPSMIDALELDKFRNR